MNQKTKSGLNKRALVLFLMLTSFLILPLSGIVLHKADMSASVEAKFISMAFHNVAALVFAVSTILHLSYNWKPILAYFKKTKENILKYPKELAIAGSIMGGLLLLALFHVFHNHI